MKDQVISLALAKKLKDLGVPQEASYWWVADVEDWTNAELVGDNWTDYSYRDCLKVAAFNVAELGEMLPRYVDIRGLMWPLEIVRTSIWRLYYGDWRGAAETAVILSAPTGASEAEARGLMLALLIEKDLMPHE